MIAFYYICWIIGIIGSYSFYIQVCHSINTELIVEPKYLECPKSDTVIWRYMDLPKLLSIISNNSLWFSRLDKLTDEYEGTVPFQNHFKIAKNLQRVDKN